VDPESGTIPQSDASRLCTTNGYVPHSWTEARAQLRSAIGLMGATVGNIHLVILAYGRFLCMYDQMQTHLESESDHARGRRLGPALVNIHAQLVWKNWLVVQLDGSERERPPPRLLSRHQHA
jgi:hypothetical protein